MSSVSILVNELGRKKGKSILKKWHEEFKMMHPHLDCTSASKETVVRDSKFSRVKNRGVVPVGVPSRNFMSINPIVY